MGEATMKLNLGCGAVKLPGYVGVDVRPVGDVVADLCGNWPFGDESVDRICASHLVEHLPEPLHTMSEAFRVLKSGGQFEIDVPSTNGMGAFQDPTHKSFWNLNSFIYYDRAAKLGEMYGYNVWDVDVVQEYLVPGIESFGPYVKAILTKPGGK